MAHTLICSIRKKICKYTYKFRDVRFKYSTKYGIMLTAFNTSLKYIISFYIHTHTRQIEFTLTLYALVLYERFFFLFDFHIVLQLRDDDTSY